MEEEEQVEDWKQMYLKERNVEEEQVEEKDQYIKEEKEEGAWLR